MPALPPVPGVAKIIVKQSLASVNVYNVLHAYKGSASEWTSGELGSLSTAVRSAWVTNFIPLQVPALTLSDVQAIDLTTDTGGSSTTSGSTAGTRTGFALSANAAVCIGWSILRRYRGGHPRTYIGGISQSDTSSANTISATAVTNFKAAATALFVAVAAVTTSAGNAALCCVHYRKDNVPLTSPTFDLFFGNSVDTRIDSQRRRLGRDR